MRSFNALKKLWDDHVSRGRHHPGLAIEDAGLVLGADTVLVRMGETRSGTKALAVEADRERLLALLGVSYRDKVPPAIVKNIENASEQWRRGDNVLAHIHLAFARLPRLESANDAYRLFLAGALLDDGLPPREMLAELGLRRTIRQLDKYDPDQPRVPAGSGRASGEWTTGDGGGEQRQKFVRRVQLNVVGATMSDANPQGIVPGAQYAQASSPPILTPERINHILTFHGAGTADKSKGKFTPEYSTAEAIRGLVEDAWKHATPEDLGAGKPSDRVVIGAGVSIIVDGVAEPFIIGQSGEERRAPSVPTNTYVVVIDSNNYVRSCYPINPDDDINPRDE